MANWTLVLWSPRFFFVYQVRWCVFSFLPPLRLPGPPLPLQTTSRLELNLDKPGGLPAGKSRLDLPAGLLHPPGCYDLPAGLPAGFFGPCTLPAGTSRLAPKKRYCARQLPADLPVCSVYNLTKQRAVLQVREHAQCSY